MCRRLLLTSRWCLDLEVVVLLHGLCEHELSHPLDALLGAVDGEMVRLLILLEKLLVGLLVVRDESESEGLLAGEGLALAEQALLEGGAELGAGCLRVSMQGILVDVNVLKSVGVGVVGVVHGELAVDQGAIVVLPLVAEHASGLALAHPTVVVGQVGLSDAGRRARCLVLLDRGD